MNRIGLKTLGRHSIFVVGALVTMIALVEGCSLHLEQRSMSAPLRRGYNTEF